jgi:nucleoid DNA-binding protein
MNFTKKDILKNITKNVGISNNDASLIMESFLHSIKSNFLLKSVKIGNFGIFKKKTTTSRPGRNPKTKECYIISPVNKLSFKASKKVKESLN